MTQGKPASWQYEPGMTRGNGQSDSCRYESPTPPCFQGYVEAGIEVRPGVSLVRIGGNRQIGVESNESHLRHCTKISAFLQEAHPEPPWRPCAAPIASRVMLVWMDLEMTGLDPSLHTIVEIATITTDDDLNILAEGPDLVIHANEDQLATMEPVVREMHSRSCLLEAMAASTLTLEEAGRQTLEFIKAQVPQQRSVPLCGNSIGTDRRFLAVQLPEIENWLHYRSVDVSSVKELCRRWYPAALRQAPTKKTSHRALDDIRESIGELAYYRRAVFATSSEPAPDSSARRPDMTHTADTADAADMTGKAGTTDT